jgi:hypothetical protein
MRIESVFQHFRYLRNVKRCKTCVSGLNALFGVPKLQIWFRNQSIHSTLFDPKWLFGVFWSISETLGKWNDARLVFWARMHYFLAPKLQRSFRNKSIHSTPMVPKSLRVFWSISETFRMKKDAKHPNDDWDIFGAFCKPSQCKKMRNLCFGPKCTILRYRSCDAFIILY